MRGLIIATVKMKIIDINGTEKEATSIKRMTNEVPDKINGGFVEEDYVEANIKGKVREWVEWYPIKTFQKLNPSIKI